MSPASLFRLLLLSAIWGGSFLLIRIGAPALGPVTLMEVRVLLAALFLAAVALALVYAIFRNIRDVDLDKIRSLNGE
jgi:drug/metabolite transporter (DMT)-like permease